MEIKLSDIHPGQRAYLLDIPGSCPLKRRLRQFGIEQGAVAQCCFFSPGKHLVALEFEGTTLALRRADLAAITARLC